MPCHEFLQWALPRLGLRWRGFRNVRGQVCKRLARRYRELGLAGLDAYRAHLDVNSAEWQVLAGLCRVTITRFGRDRAVWRRLVDVELPRLADQAAAAGRRELSAWSAGCAGGEEPYTLCIAWQLELAPRWPGLRLTVLGTDIDDEELARAEAARYPDGALTELDAPWRAEAFDADGRVKQHLRAMARFAKRDLREGPATGGPFDLVFCRNLAFTYFDEAVQHTVLAKLRGALREGGVLVIGGHEALPGDATGFVAVAPAVFIAA